MLLPLVVRKSPAGSRRPRAIPIACALGALSLFFSIAAIASADSKQSNDKLTYTPAITLTLEVQTPSGAPRVYPTASGLSYWADDMPVAKGDQVKLDVFVATGGGELQGAKVRLDNQPIATLDKSPWSTTINTDAIGAGDHFLEVWAQELEPDGKRTAYAIKTMTFTVASNLPGVGSGPVSAVAGVQQVLSGNSVTNVPLTGPGQPPALPQPIAGSAADATATVSLAANDPTAEQALASGNVVSLSAPIVVSVHAPAGSTAHRFVYALVRGDQTIYESDQPSDINLAQIRLQQRSGTEPGLLPGRIVLWVWGVNNHGDYGTPISAIFDVAPAVS